MPEPISRDHLLSWGKYLKKCDYRFHAPTPATHRRVLKKDLSPSPALHRLFGWNVPVPVKDLPPELRSRVMDSPVVHVEEDRARSLYRASTLENLLFFHSSFPTEDARSVFFGPDTYRFAAYLKRQVSSARKIWDLGCGAGAGGIYLSKSRPSPEIYFSDVNPSALSLTEINAEINEITGFRLKECSFLEQAPPDIDLVIANPPYIIDPTRRLYRHGGDLYGMAFSLKVVSSFLSHCRPQSRLLLYTGAVFVAGEDVFLKNLRPILAREKVSWTYSELDPDIFGEQLELPEYKEVERISAVGLCLQLLPG
jgi:hypothetical protein